MKKYFIYDFYNLDEKEHHIKYKASKQDFYKILKLNLKIESNLGYYKTFKEAYKICKNKLKVDKAFYCGDYGFFIEED